jgi:hypothetical protein
MLNTALSQQLFLDSQKETLTQGLAHLAQLNFNERLWAKDTTLWKKEPEHAKIIAHSLGWLTIAEWIQERLPEL